MSALALTLILTLVMLVVIGVQESTTRVLRVLVASGVLLAGTYFFAPDLAAVLTPGGPSRASSSQPLRDDRGQAFYSQEYLLEYQGNHNALAAITYLSASMLAASVLLLFYRLFIAGVDTARHPPIPREKTARK